MLIIRTLIALSMERWGWARGAWLKVIGNQWSVSVVNGLLSDYSNRYFHG